jgi:alkanesulfonate monooxygenase SsuD/methylene tetrahydromethanopterin reductase-like flavin-dependent oxidoreductase (luciferase family)
MRFGVHLPVVDFGDGSASVRDLQEYVRVARELGYDTVGANDHLVWHRPWLDGLTALAAVAGQAAGMALATTVALPTLRRPVVLAKALTSLGALHGGPVIAGVGPGSSRADYDAVGVAFAERWSRFDADTVALRRLLCGDGEPRLAPLADPVPQLWVGSWGSDQRLRAMAATADGWLASGYNTTPEQYTAGRARLDGHLEQVGRDPAAFPDLIATVWLHVTPSAAEASAVLADVLAPTLRRDPQELAARLPVGTPEHCIAVLSAYAEAGAQRMLLWPIRNPTTQLDVFAELVAPHIPR